MLMGNCANCYVGYASNYDIRYNSSSGGLVTALLISALEDGLIDGALVTRVSKHKPLLPEAFVARNQEEIISACGSKYCPVPVNILLKKILREKGRFAVVGLPCHIHGIRKFERINKRLRERILLHLGLFCANGVTFLGTEYFLQGWKIKKESVNGLNYRGKGWPGRIVVQLKDEREKIIPRGTTEKSLFRRVLFYSAFHYDFTHPRCLLCSDLTNVLSDISFGDPWLPDVLKEEKIGKSLVISRSKIGDEILRRALTKREVEMVEIRARKVLQAQNFGFKRDVGSRLRAVSSWGKPVPRYVPEPAESNRFKRANMLFYLPSYFSARKYLWRVLYANAIIRQFSMNVLNAAGSRIATRTRR